MHSLEITELQFEKEHHTLLCTNTVHELSLKNAWLHVPQFSFWISITLGKIYLSRIIINRGKNTFELVGTVLKHKPVSYHNNYNTVPCKSKLTVSFQSRFST